MDLHLLIAILIMVTVAAFFGALVRDICFALGGKAWSEKAFTKQALAEDGIDWDPATDGRGAVPVSASTFNVRPALAWRSLQRSHATTADLAGAESTRRRSRGAHRKPSTGLPYQRWLAMTDDFIRSIDTREAARCTGAVLTSS